MHNVVILGSGRCGTSLLAGMLLSEPYRVPGRIWPANAGNPRGIFESLDVNLLNEQLMGIPPLNRITSLWRRFFPGTPEKPSPGQGWLFHPPLDWAPRESTDSWDQAVDRLLAGGPWVLKDPRFSFTLSSWLPHFPDQTRIVLLFRHPVATRDSMIRECAHNSTLKGFPLSPERALGVWEAHYRHLLTLLPRIPFPWLALSFDDLFSPAGQSTLSGFLGRDLNQNFPEARLNRHPTPTGMLSASAAMLWQQLLTLRQEP